jgi:hypothetical protein
MVNITMLTVTGTASLINVLSIGPSVRSMRLLLRFVEGFVSDFDNLSRTLNPESLNLVPIYYDLLNTPSACGGLLTWQLIRPSHHSREGGNPVIAMPFLDSGSPLRCSRNDEFSCRVISTRKRGLGETTCPPKYNQI